MKFNLFIIFLLSFSNIFSQSFFNARVWCFGIGNKIEFNDSLNFSNSQINSDESSSSICDANGNLLIYTNGNSVYNKYDKIIRNGNDVGFKLSNNTTTSKMGSILITHYDNKDSFVYLFNTDYEGGSNGLVYSKISSLLRIIFPPGPSSSPRALTFALPIATVISFCIASLCISISFPCIVRYTDRCCSFIAIVLSPYELSFTYRKNSCQSKLNFIGSM